jgi:hypothetical protein
MSDLITTSLLNLQKEEDAITVLTAKGSAFQSVANKGTITLRGKIKKSLKVAEGQNFSVKEGAKKLVLKSEFGEDIVLPSKKAFIVVTTMEAAEAEPDVINAFTTLAPGVFAQEFDYNVAGLTADVNAGGIKALTASTPVVNVEVVDAASLKGAYGALASTGVLPTAWVLSTALFGDLISLDATETDRKLSNEVLTNKTLLGLPVQTFRSTAKVGFLRDFSKDEWAIKDDKTIVRIAKDGVITDSEGVVHNLTQDNKTAYILEGFYSWYANPENSTVVLANATV